MKNTVFAYGADFGWVSQLEELGINWVNEKGEPSDPYTILAELGGNAVRLRVFTDPPRIGFWQKRDGSICMLGRCDAESVLAAARRVKEHGFRLMLDFHYSDHFADPAYQEIPSDWLLDDEDRMAEHVAEHTRRVLKLLASEGIVPDWVQVGNEINPGILLPMGDLSKHPKSLVRFLNAGYDAVKEVCPHTFVITHLAELQTKALCDPFLENFFENGGRTDILGFSYYPYWTNYSHSREKLEELFRYYHDRYKKPLMLTEIGEPETKEEECFLLLKDAIESLMAIPDGGGLGLFYWEPEIVAGVLPDSYPLGAARQVGPKTLQFTGALKAYRS